MTLHVVLGDGEMTRKELIATLNDLWEQEGEEGSFWFLLQGKSDPTDTDKALTAWLAENELFYAVVTDDKSSLHSTYNSRAQIFEAKQLTKKILSLLQSEPEGDEGVDVLALFTSDDPEAEEDRWLNDLCGEISAAGHTIRALNDGLTVLDFESQPEEEEEEVVAPTKSKTKPKLAAVPEPEIEMVEVVTGMQEINREYLETLDLPALKEIAAGLGIELPPRTRSTTYINTILGEDDDTPEAEVEEIAATNGHAGADVDLDALADVLTDLVIANIIKKVTASLV
jgi:hypothetical protein